MVEIRNLQKRFDTENEKVQAIKGISMEVAEGSLLTVLGPSGCGKSTTLRCLAGLEKPEQGFIKIGGKVVFSSEEGLFEPPERRPIGMVFQSYAIWPHMTVAQNVAYPLEGRGHGKKNVAEKVNRALSLVGLTGLADRAAPQLSGGQQQRVAVARALVDNPRVLLLDEPLSNLDAKLRQHMRGEIRELVKRSGLTTVYVTHDQEEALAVSDEIVFMVDGRIVEAGRPEEIYRKPRKRLTAEFFGEANFVNGTVRGREHDYLMVETSLGLIACCWDQRSPGEEVCLFFRPEDVDVSREGSSGRYFLMGVIQKYIFLGKSIECIVQTANGNHLKVSVDSNFCPRQMEEVYLMLRPDSCYIVGD